MFVVSRSAASRGKRILSSIRRRPYRNDGIRSLSTMSVMDEEEENNNDNNVGMKEYPNLFEPISLHNGKLILPNRILMGSMHTGLEGHSIPKFVSRYILGASSNHNHVDGTDLTAMAEYFAERARGGVSLMVTGGIAPNWQGTVGPFAAKLSTRQEMESHRIVPRAVHEASSDTKARICLQILHAGRYSYHPWAVSASATKSPISPFKARALSQREIRQTIDDFANCASLAQEAGYDGVEIMASEGYLLSQFLCTRTNLRQDEYGNASLENRARLPLEIVRRVRQVCGEDFIIIFRISLMDLVDKGLDWGECVQLAQWVEQAGASILNTGIGWHEARVPTIATVVPRAAFVHPTRVLKESGVVNIPLVATNRINTPQVAQDVLSSGSADMVSMARPFLADSHLINKAREGRADEINTCIACNQACLDHAFVGKTASCLVNPRACHETQLQDPNQVVLPQRLKLGVIGAGPSGCAFALTAARLGHDVTLYDGADRLGGQFNMAKRIPGKEEFHETMRYFRIQLERHGVDIQLNTRMTYEDLERQRIFDKWIIATGVEPRNPEIPGMEHANVLSYIDVLKHNATVGQKVAVIGAGGIGFDVSEFLLHHDGKDKHPSDLELSDFWKDWGVDPSNETRGGLLSNEDEKEDKTSSSPQREIIMLQRKSGKLGAGLGRTTGWIHRATLQKSGSVKMMDGVTYNKIDEKGHLHVTTKDGTKHVLEVDNIVICAGQVEEDSLRVAAQEHSPLDLAQRIYTIGGAQEAGELDAKRAIDMATRLAMRIHEPEVVPGQHVFRDGVGVEEKLFQFLKRWT